MAWALKEPTGFGNYWPHGDFRKWDEGLEDRFKNYFSNAERESFGNRCIKYQRDLLDRIQNNGAPLLPDERPTSFETNKSYSDLVSMIGTENMLVAVDDDVKDVINAVDPGVHEFLPIDLNMPCDKVYPKRYNILVIRNTIQGFVPIEGTHDPRDKEPLYFAHGDDKASYQKLCVSKQAIGEAHLWRDTKMRRPNIFISDRLQSAIAERGLKIFRHYRVREV